MAREKEEVAAQQDAAMQAVQSKVGGGKADPSPLAKLDIGLFFKRIVGCLARLTLNNV